MCSGRPARLRTLLWKLLVAAALFATAARAESPRERFSAGGYLRVMTRPDFEGGNSKLGFWNLYGRLLNEGPYGALELKLDVLQAPSGTRQTWASVHTRLEGGSFSNTDATNGALSAFRVSQLYVKAGNVLFDRVTWQLGTLESWFGDLGLYDLRPASLFNDTVGLSARYELGPVELLMGVGDAGFAVRGPRYSTLFTTGTTLRVRLGGHAELGLGGQLSHEPSVKGNRFAPYVTPGLRYEDLLRGEVAKRFLEEYPNQEDLFPKPEPVSATSYKAVGYFGFGKLGPLRWSSLYASFRKLHPDGYVTEQYQGREYTIYPTALTDERTQLLVGNEMQLVLWPERLDLVWAVLYGRDLNADNTVAAGDDNRQFASTVARLQLYFTRTVHWLLESSLANEQSLNGNLYREHADSVFANTGGISDARGLELGDTDTRNTWQLKTGLVLNPTGLGIYTRPSLRLLYGLQYSNQQAAYGNGFVESLDQYNVFPSPERHWHSVVALEAEAWF